MATIREGHEARDLCRCGDCAGIRGSSGHRATARLGDGGSQEPTQAQASTQAHSSAQAPPWAHLGEDSELLLWMLLVNILNNMVTESSEARSMDSAFSSEAVY